MPPLNRALALAQAHDIPVLVGQHLKLDVPRMLDVLLHVKIAVAKGSGGLGLRRLEKTGQFFFVAHDAHASSAASGRSLHDHGKSDLLRPLQRLTFARDDPVRPRQNRHARLLHRRPGLFLLAHQAHDFRPRPNELDPAHLADFGEVRILGQQTISRMNRLHIGDLSRADHPGNIQVAVRQLRRTDADGLVGKTNGQRIAVGLAVDGDRADTQFLARANHAQRNFPAIRNKDLLEHE